MADRIPNDSSLSPSRRELLTGTGTIISASTLGSRVTTANPTRQVTGTRPIVFTHTTVVTGYADRAPLVDVALAVSGDRIAAIGPTDDVLRAYPNAEVVDGRRKALLPGVVNCHGHLAATISRGFGEDFGFPGRSFLKVSAGSLLSQEESTLMAVIGALDSIRSGTTTMLENWMGIAASAAELAKTGQRLVFAEFFRDREDSPAGPMSPERLAASGPPRFSAKMRDEGMQRISDLFTAWHDKENGRIRVFPSATLAEDSSPEMLQAVRAFADKHDLGYKIHLNQSEAETQYMLRYHGVRPAAYLDRHGFLGPRLIAGHCRYVDQSEVDLLGAARCTVAHQASMAANRGVSPPIPALRDAGCTISLGTDNINNDMFAVMKVAMLTERIRRSEDEHPGMLPQPEDILEDAALGGARATHQIETNGSLEVGKKADIIVLDTFKPYLVPAGRILSAWLHNGQASDIESVLVDGTFILRDNKMLTVDEPLIVAEAEKIGQRVWKQVLDAHPINLPPMPDGRPREPITRIPTWTLED